MPVYRWKSLWEKKENLKIWRKFTQERVRKFKLFLLPWSVRWAGGADLFFVSAALRCWRDQETEYCEKTVDPADILLLYLKYKIDYYRRWSSPLSLLCAVMTPTIFVVGACCFPGICLPADGRKGLGVRPIYWRWDKNPVEALCAYGIAILSGNHGVFPD